MGWAMETPLLRIEHLTKVFRLKHGLTVKALDDFSLSLQGNQIVGILGKNGAGKTTLVKACCNLLTFDGMIAYDGHRLRGGSSRLNRFYAAVLEGNRNIYWKLTPLENIRYFAALRFRRERDYMPYAIELLKGLELFDRRNVLTERLSRGMQQKTAIICALVLQTPVLFLDEPTLGLDVESARHMTDFFNRRDLCPDRLICMTSHHLDFLERVADDILIVKEGRLLDLTVLNSLRNATNCLEFTLAGPGSEEELHLLLDEGLISCRRNGEAWSVVIDPGEDPLPMVVTHLERAGINIIAFKRLGFDLETMYLLAQQEGTPV